MKGVKKWAGISYDVLRTYEVVPEGDDLGETVCLLLGDPVRGEPR